MEQRKSHTNAKGKTQARETFARLNTDVVCDGGLKCSSDETPVMGAERRLEVVQLTLPLTTSNGREKGELTKSFPITKQMVWSAYKKVRSNKGASGIDNETIKMYEERLEDNLYILWNRLSSGSYFPKPVLEVSIPKGDGRLRRLGIPTVNDRIAQEVVKSYLEPRLEAEFSEHSYGYRPLRSTHEAVAAVRENVRNYRWVIDMDITGFFDNMSHELLFKAIEKHVEEKWVKMYIKRWLEAPIEDKQGNKRYRHGKGTPQGGVISPLLANLFLHYAFDKWFAKAYPELTFVRYADDIIVHCNNQIESGQVLKAIKQRLKACNLEANAEKTKIVYCKDANRKGRYKTVQFDFLGFSFQPRPTPTKEGKMFLGYDCSISKRSMKRISEELRKSRFHLWTTTTITQIAEEFNPKIRGWINYYGKFRKFGLMRVFKIFHWRLIKWAVCRYKRFRNSMYKAGRWLRQLSEKNPKIFVHWQYGFKGA